MLFVAAKHDNSCVHNKVSSEICCTLSVVLEKGRGLMRIDGVGRLELSVRWMTNTSRLPWRRM